MAVEEEVAPDGEERHQPWHRCPWLRLLHSRMQVPVSVYCRAPRDLPVAVQPTQEALTIAIIIALVAVGIPGRRRGAGEVVVAV